MESRAAVRAALLQTQKRVQVVFSCPETGSPDLENATCHRYIYDGTLFETVLMDGDVNQLSEDQWEEFLARYPISTRAERNS